MPNKATSSEKMKKRCSGEEVGATKKQQTAAKKERREASCVYSLDRGPFLHSMRALMQK